MGDVFGFFSVDHPGNQRHQSLPAFTLVFGHCLESQNKGMIAGRCDNRPSLLSNQRCLYGAYFQEIVVMEVVTRLSLLESNLQPKPSCGWGARGEDWVLEITIL